MTRAVELPTRPEPMTVTVKRMALIVVDMQNAYCSPGATSTASDSVCRVRSR